MDKTLVTYQECRGWARNRAESPSEERMTKACLTMTVPTEEEPRWVFAVPNATSPTLVTTTTMRRTISKCAYPTGDQRMLTAIQPPSSPPPSPPQARRRWTTLEQSYDHQWETIESTSEWAGSAPASSPPHSRHVTPSPPPPSHRKTKPAVTSACCECSSQAPQHSTYPGRSCQAPT
jgi:hypothetical protein